MTTHDGTSVIRLNSLLIAAALAGSLFAPTAQAQTVTPQALHGHIALPAAARAQAVDRLAATQQLNFTIGLPVSDQAALTEFLKELSDPSSPNYRKFLTPQQFTDKFSPTAADYQAVLDYARANGFTVTKAHSNRLLVSVSAPVSAVEKAFHVTMRHYKHPTEGRNFYAPDAEPTLNLTVPVQDIGGLDDFIIPQSMIRAESRPANAVPLGGTSPNGDYWGADFRNAYAAGATNIGTGQSCGTINFGGYYQSDVRRYQASNNIPFIPIVEELLDGVTSDTNGASAEEPLDLEMISSMAPGLNSIYFYDGESIDTMLSAIASDDVAKQIGASWIYGTDGNTDILLQQLNAEGITFFNASGDWGAYPDTSYLTAPNCVCSPYVTCVGGTQLAMNGSGSSYASEQVWNNHSSGKSADGGGVSPYYAIPFWQQGISMIANDGSTTMRNIPDVALTGANVFVYEGNGGQGGYDGTSCACPLWTGFMALVNQQNAANGQPSVGALNPLVYAIGKSSAYTAAFHDITVGTNGNATTYTNYLAVPGYDLCTGWGTPVGQTTINALTEAPFLATALPATLTAFAGSTNSLTVSAGGQATLAYQWQDNGTNISGANGAALIFTNLQPASSGAYCVIVTNNFGAVTSTICELTVISPSPYQGQMLSNGPVAYYPLNETSGPTAYDLVGDNNGTDNGSLGFGVPGPTVPAWPGFVFGNMAYTFNGNNTSVAIPPLNLTSNITLTAWINPGVQNSSYFPGIISWSNNTNTTALCLGNGDNQLAYLAEGLVYTPSAVQVPTNQWSFVALELTPTSSVIYLATNSTLQTFNIGTTNRSPASFTSTGYLGQSPYNYYNGAMGQVAIYNQALSPAQLSSLISAAVVPNFPYIYVALSAPTNGSTFADNANITLAASIASYEHTINQVQFFNGTNLLGTSATSPYQYTWSGMTPGSYTLSAQVDYDGAYTVTSSPVNVTITYVPSVVVNDSATTPANTPVTIPVLANDTAFNGYPLSILSITQPAHGTAAISGTNVVYTPNQYWYGVDTFNYTTGDGHAAPATASVSVTVPFPNLIPNYTNAVVSAGPVAFYPLNEISGTTAYDFISGNNGTDNGAIVQGGPGPSSPMWPGFGVTNTAYALPGTNAYVSLPVLNLTSNITFTAWVKPGVPQSPIYPGIVSWYDYNNGDILSMGAGNGANRLSFFGNTVYIEPSVVPTNQVWSFVALVATPTNAVLYLATNSVLQAFNTGTTNTDLNAFTSNGAGYIGENPFGYYFKGGIANVAIFNYALTSSQLNGLLSAALTGVPAVSLAAPTNGSVLSAASPITLTATVDTNGNHTVQGVQFFNGSSLLGSASTPPYQYVWSGAPLGTNTLLAKVQFDSTLVATSSVVSIDVITGVASNPTNIIATVNGNTLILNWPADHTGWTLQAQTNGLGSGLGTNWVDVAGSASVNGFTNVINPANGSVFYRLKSTP